MPPDPREELLRQIRSIRRRVDPDVLTRAAAAASTTEAAKAAGVRPGQAGQGAVGPGAVGPGDVRLDMSGARQAVEMFLRSRNDGGRFALQLMERMRRPDEVARAYRGPDDPDRPKPRIHRKLVG